MFLADTARHPAPGAWITIGYAGGPYYEACVAASHIRLCDGTVVYVTRTTLQRELLFLWTPHLEWWPLDSRASGAASPTSLSAPLVLGLEGDPVPQLTEPWLAPSRILGRCPALVPSLSSSCSSSSSSSSSCSDEPRRCGRTVLHFPYCPHHLATILGLRVGPSHIPDAGLGVFATRDLQKGWVFPYGGELVRDVVLKMRYPDGGDLPEYAFKVSKGLYLDAKCKRGIGSMMNQSRGERRACGQFDRWNMDQQVRALEAGTTRPEDVCSVLFVLTRNVKCGTELLASYGNKEWVSKLRAQ